MQTSEFELNEELLTSRNDVLLELPHQVFLLGLTSKRKIADFLLQANQDWSQIVVELQMNNNIEVK